MKPRLNRTLKRGVENRPFEEDDMKWLWAAYKLGALENFPKNKTIEEFKGVVFGQLDFVHVVDIVVAKTERGSIPVGVITADIDSLGLWPATDWFPWASPRNKIEGVIAYINTARRSHLVLFLGDIGGKAFLTHVCKYGIMRRVGTLEKNGERLALFQSKEVKNGAF